MHEQEKQTVMVEGHGKVSALPDKMVSTIGIRTENLQLQVAQQENAVIATRVIQALQRIGILPEDIVTTAYLMQPKYDFVEGQSLLAGYEVEHLLEVTVRNVQQAGKVYDVATEAGANIARNLQFQVSNEHLYYQQALQLAIRNADEKAQAITQPVGVSLFPVPIRITEVTEAQTPIIRDHALMAVATPIQPREVTIEARLKVVFKYE